MTQPIAALTERDTAHLEREVAKYQLSIANFVIETEQHYTDAGEMLRVVATRRKEAYDFLTEDIEAANKLHKSLTKKRNALAEPWDKIRAKIESVMRAAKLKWEKEAEEARAEAEKAAAQLVKTAQREARKIAETGDIQRARQMIEEAKAIAALPAQIEATAPKVEGIKVPEKWTGVCGDVMALVKAVAEGKIPLMHETRVKGVPQQECLFVVNQRILDQMADRQHEAFQWPGCTSKRDIEFRVNTL